MESNERGFVERFLYIYMKKEDLIIILCSSWCSIML